jgi:hypothetical protein
MSNYMLTHANRNGNLHFKKHFTADKLKLKLDVTKLNFAQVTITEVSPSADLSNEIRRCGPLSSMGRVGSMASFKRASCAAIGGLF